MSTRAIRRSVVFCLAVSAALLLQPGPLSADPNHPHCDRVVNWMFGRTLRGGRIVVNPAEQSVLFRVGLIPEVPPVSTVADCAYETSDITTINITYGFAGPTFFARFIQATTSYGTEVDEGQDFVSGEESDLTFPAHERGGDALHVLLPNDRLTITLRGIDRANLPAAGGRARVKLTGNHYYRTTIPEPSTVVLLASGLAGVAWLSRRRRSAEPE